MGEMSRQPGKSTHANDAYEVAGRDLRKPGKGTLVTDYIKHGSTCDAIGKMGLPTGCFLDNDARARLADLFRRRVDRAATNFALAITELITDELLKKEEDLPLIVSFVLDIISSHASEAINSLVGKMAASGLAGVERDAIEAGIADYVDDAAARAVSSKQIATVVKSAVDKTKKAAIAAAQPKGGKAVAVNHLARLRLDAQKSFQGLSETGPADMTDTELFALFASYDIEHHAVEAYKDAVTQKLARYKTEGVGDVGETPLVRTKQGGVGRKSTKVAWLVYSSGSPDQLVYEHYVGGTRAPRMPSDNPFVPGSNAKLADSPDLEEVEWTWDRYVSKEFETEAIMRHEDAWGVAPRKIPLDDRLPQAPKPVPRLDLGSQPVAVDKTDSRSPPHAGQEPAPDYTNAFKNVDLTKVKGNSDHGT